VKSVLSFAVIVLFSVRPAYPAVTFDEYTANYLEHMKRKAISAFYSECGRSSGKAALVFGMGEKTALLIETERGTVVNLATISTGRSDFTIDETHGGTYSYERVRNLVKELLGYPFKFVMADKINEITRSKPTRMCQDKPPV